MTYHFFDTDDAKAFNVEKAVLISHFRFWIRKNKAEQRHCHDGHTWTYASRQGLQKLFPYFTVNQLRRHLESLVKDGVLLSTSKYSQFQPDRTLWYAFADERRFLHEAKVPIRNGENAQRNGENAQRNGENAPPIPDISGTDKSGTDNPPLPPAEPGGASPPPVASLPEPKKPDTPFDTIVYPQWCKWGQRRNSRGKKWVEVPRPGTQTYDLWRNEINLGPKKPKRGESQLPDASWNGAYPLSAVWDDVCKAMETAHFVHEDWRPGMELLTRRNDKGELLRECLIAGDYLLSKREKFELEHRPPSEPVPNAPTTDDFKRKQIQDTIGRIKGKVQRGELSQAAVQSRLDQLEQQLREIR